MNPNALYKDTLYFNNDNMKRTSNNKSARDETYSYTECYRTGGLFVLKKKMLQNFGVYIMKLTLTLLDLCLVGNLSHKIYKS